MARKQQDNPFYPYLNALRVGKVRALISSLNKNHKEVTMEEIESVLKECANIISAIKKDSPAPAFGAKAAKTTSARTTEAKLFSEDNDLDA
jgi:uncharacterized protein (DUF1810 family)